MHICMADTGRSRRALGISVTVAVFLSVRDWTWFLEPEGPGRGM